MPCEPFYSGPNQISGEEDDPDTKADTKADMERFCRCSRCAVTEAQR